MAVGPEMGIARALADAPGRERGLEHESRKEARPSFLKKEAKKTFDYFGFGLSERPKPRSQKFFGSFFQKRTAFFSRE
jgi:hypothetical protein